MKTLMTERFGLMSQVRGCTGMAERRIEEIKELEAVIATLEDRIQRGQAYLDAHGLHGDEKRRKQLWGWEDALTASQGALTTRKAELVRIMRPLWPGIGRLWAAAAAAVSDRDDTPIEIELNFGRMTRLMGWWEDCLRRCLPESEYPTLVREGGYLTDEELEVAFHATKLPETTTDTEEAEGLAQIERHNAEAARHAEQERMRYLKCKSCGEKAARETVKSLCRNGTWQVWEQCEVCGGNANGGGKREGQKGQDIATLREAERETDSRAGSALSGGLFGDIEGQAAAKGGNGKPRGAIQT